MLKRETGLQCHTWSGCGLNWKGWIFVSFVNYELNMNPIKTPLEILEKTCRNASKVEKFWLKQFLTFSYFAQVQNILSSWLYFLKIWTNQYLNLNHCDTDQAVTKDEWMASITGFSLFHQLHSWLLSHPCGSEPFFQMQNKCNSYSYYKNQKQTSVHSEWCIHIQIHGVHHSPSQT